MASYSNNLKVLAIAVLSITALADLAWAEQWRIIGSQRIMRFISVPESEAPNRQIYHEIADQVCTQGEICILHFFADREQVDFPFSDEDLAAQTASLNRNPNTGLRQLLLACRLDPDPERCF